MKMYTKTKSEMRIANGYAHLAGSLTDYVKSLDESKRPTLLEWMSILNTTMAELIRQTLVSADEADIDCKT